MEPWRRERKQKSKSGEMGLEWAGWQISSTVLQSYSKDILFCHEKVNTKFKLKNAMY